MNIDKIRKSIQYALQLEDILPSIATGRVMQIFHEVSEMAGQGILDKIKDQGYTCTFIKDDKWYTASQPTKELSICHAALAYLNGENDDN